MVSITASMSYKTKDVYAYINIDPKLLVNVLFRSMYRNNPNQHRISDLPPIATNARISLIGSFEPASNVLLAQFGVGIRLLRFDSSQQLANKIIFVSES